MTLINYLSRVHFADGVLEVALGSELELNNLGHALLVSEPDVNHDLAERVVSGVPFGVAVSKQLLAASESAERCVAKLALCVQEKKPDVLIAFGSSRVLYLADACCKQFGAGPFEGCNAGSSSAGRAVMPELIAIPGVDGVPTMSARSRQDDRRSGARYIDEGIQPTAVIFDPTIILGESVERTASAVATTLARCLSAHLSLGYNPPAEGIAVDGLRRIVRHLPALLTDDTLAMRRELMAASLNGTLALQKVAGIAQDICRVLVNSSSRPLDEGALLRLLIAIEVELMEQSLSEAHALEARSAIDIPLGASLTEWLIALLQKLPLPESFHAMGIDSAQLANAANEIVGRRVSLVPTAEQLCDMLTAVKLKSAGRLV